MEPERVNNDSTKIAYVLVDLAGGVEDSRMMTEQEAKVLNDNIFEKEKRFIKWIPRHNNIIFKFGYCK